ncbi:MAG TPA: porin family protein [Hanamia sp.]|nr:porin family protein [Hanamia sp.]
MKKLFLAITVFAFSVITAQAQTTSFGLKAGMTDANMKFSGSGVNISLTSKIGFYAGAFADIGVSENFGVQPELFYSSLGAKSKGTGGNPDATLDLGYINLPILAKYKKDGFSAFLGPQIGYLLSAKTKSSSSTQDEKDQFNSTDFSGIIGASYTLMNGFGFDARYQLGFSNIAKNSSGDGTVKNSAFMIGIHYVFNK